jgi:hypothetical protein
MRPNLVKSLLLLVCVALMGASAWADGVTVQNASFETTNTLGTPCGTGCAYNSGPIPGWTILAGLSGSWQPNATYFNLPLPDGNIVAYTYGAIVQDLGALTANTNYTLSVFVGDRLDGQSGNYLVGLIGGDSLMCSSGGASSAIGSGFFAQKTCSFSTGSAPLGDLSIVLESTGGGQSDFDKVSVSTPEPSSVLLLGAGLMLSALCLAFSARKMKLRQIAS